MNTPEKTGNAANKRKQAILNDEQITTIEKPVIENPHVQPEPFLGCIGLEATKKKATFSRKQKRNMS